MKFCPSVCGLDARIFIIAQCYDAVAGTAVLVTYVWHITFFGGCLAISGYMEKGQRHGLTCRKIKPKSEAGQ